MNAETVKLIMDAMQSGMTQREAEKQLGISTRTIGKVARENGYVADRAGQNRKGQLRSEKNLERWAKMHQTSDWNTKPKPGNIRANSKPVERVTTSHVRMSPAEKWNSENFWFYDLDNIEKDCRSRCVK